LSFGRRRRDAEGGRPSQSATGVEDELALDGRGEDALERGLGRGATIAVDGRWEGGCSVDRLAIAKAVVDRGFDDWPELVLVTLDRLCA
jgi:hypothetical protein